jgi:hypothetical protein
LASAYGAIGDNANSHIHLLAQERILDGLMKTDPLNMEHRTDWITLQRLLARADSAAGNGDAALTRLKRTETTVDQMIAFDPSNEIWAQRKAKLELDMREIEATTQKRSQQ